MTGEQGARENAPEQTPVEAGATQQDIPTGITADELLQRNHNQRKQRVDSQLGSLLVEPPVYYYRNADSTGTQG